MTYKKSELEYYVGQFMIFPSSYAKFAFVEHPDFEEQNIYAKVYSDGEIELVKEHTLEEFIDAGRCEDLFVIYRGHNPSDILPDRRTKKNTKDLKKQFVLPLTWRKAMADIGGIFMKINKIETYGWEAAVRGMRNPMNSWDKSDSWFRDFDFYHKINGEIFDGVPDHNDNVFIGENDLKLMKQLVSAGTDHSKFMRMIIFSCDINAPLYWWKEMDTYKVGTVRNSCSTMHKIMEHEFTEKDFAFEHVREGYKDFIIRELNHLRKCYLHVKDMASDNTSKDIWYELIQVLPSSYMQKATWTANYQVLRNIYHARKNHKLYEWHEFCDTIKTLPYSELITA